MFSKYIGYYSHIYPASWKLTLADMIYSTYYLKSAADDFKNIWGKKNIDESLIMK